MVRVERLFHHHWQCRWGGWSRSLFLLYLLRSFLRIKRIWNAAISEAKNKTTIGRRDILCYWFIWITASLLFYNTKQISCYSENLQQWEAKKGFSVGVCIISGWYYTVFWLNFLWPLSMVWALRLLWNDSVMFQREQREWILEDSYLFGFWNEMHDCICESFNLHLKRGWIQRATHSTVLRIYYKVAMHISKIPYISILNWLPALLNCISFSHKICCNLGGPLTIYNFHSVESILYSPKLCLDLKISKILFVFHETCLEMAISVGQFSVVKCGASQRTLHWKWFRG